MVVDNADGLHPGVDDRRADELEAVEIRSETGEDATQLRPSLFTTLPSVKDQQKSLKLSPRSSISQ